MGSFSKVTKLVWDEISKPEGFKKGDEFEDYIRKHLFTKDRFIILHRTHDYATNKNDYIDDSKLPDFKFRAIRTGKEFFVEAKYRSTYYEDKVEWCKPFQLRRYKRIDKEELPVYITLGLGGEADSPAQIFLIPVKDIKYLKLFRSFLRNYAVPNDKPVDYERLQ